MISNIGGGFIRKLGEQTSSVVQRADDALDFDNLLSLILKHKAQIVSWCENEGVDLVIDSFTEHGCSKLAGFIHTLLPLPLKLVISKAFISDLIWSNANAVNKVLTA